ncbi:transcriptional regulator, MarR family with acetyltransferase activity [Rhizobacter sp. OV335]|nr:transcriptional regulator, MarR family with acetyltransferase activity [Rhizobacter sp. OV335]
MDMGDVVKPERSLVEEIRAASRSMARDWGFMGGRFAGADLSPSAVHALIEIDAGEVSARDLGVRLRLEKSSVSRMLRKLVDSGDVCEAPCSHDSRIKLLSLTPVGRRRVAAIHAHARGQVADALGRLTRGQHHTVLDGLRLYSEALAGVQETRPDPSTVEVMPGYQPGLIARITQMHALHCAREPGFGQRFESVVAAGLADFCDRLGKPRNAIWTAHQAGDIVGSVAIDGDEPGAGVAHLRWFIVDDGTRGSGVGRKLLASALDFADGQGFAETRLWAINGSSAGRHLCESHGFVCEEERPATQWGKGILEQRFARRRP